MTAQPAGRKIIAMNKRLIVLILSISTIVAYGYALGGLGSYAMGVPKPVPIAAGLSCGTVFAVAALRLWKGRAEARAHRGGAFVRHGLRRRGAEALEELPRRARTREESPRSGRRAKRRKIRRFAGGGVNAPAAPPVRAARLKPTPQTSNEPSRAKPTPQASNADARREFTKTTKRIGKSRGFRPAAFFVFRRAAELSQTRRRGAKLMKGPPRRFMLIDLT